jgi:hypothetical protein
MSKRRKLSGGAYFDGDLDTAYNPSVTSYSQHDPQRSKQTWQDEHQPNEEEQQAWHESPTKRGLDDQFEQEARADRVAFEGEDLESSDTRASGEHVEQEGRDVDHLAEQNNDQLAEQNEAKDKQQEDTSSNVQPTETSLNEVEVEDITEHEASKSDSRGSQGSRGSQSSRGSRGSQSSQGSRGIRGSQANQDDGQDAALQEEDVSMRGEPTAQDEESAMQNQAKVPEIKLSSDDYFKMTPIEQKYVQLKVQQEILKTYYSKEARIARAKQLYEVHYNIQRAKKFFKVVDQQVVVAKPVKRQVEYFQIWLSLCAEWVLDELQKCRQDSSFMTQEWAEQRAQALNQITKVIKSSALLCGVEYNDSLRDLADYVRSVNPDLDAVILQGLDDPDQETPSQDEQTHRSADAGFGTRQFCEAQHCDPGQTVKDCYRKNALKLHPDKNPGPNAKAEFQELKTRYDNAQKQHSDSPPDPNMVNKLC